MAKDDYDVLVFKILTYLYGCFKGKIVFENETFNETALKNCEHETYKNNILYAMESEGLISDITITKAWGGDLIISSDLSNMRITADGIHYLKDNNKMQAVKKHLIETADTMAALAIKII